MPRKFAIVALSMTFLAGLTLADEESPLEKLMEKIQAKTNAIRKVTRNAAEYKKGAASIAKDTEEIVKLAKESRDMKEPSDKEKKPLAEWQKLTDDMIHATEELGKITADSKTTQAQAKEAFTTFTKTCSACHTIYKKED